MQNVTKLSNFDLMTHPKIFIDMRVIKGHMRINIVFFNVIMKLDIPIPDNLRIFIFN